jgi:hypothetical protein
MSDACVSVAEIARQRSLGWPDFHPESYCHKCGRKNIRAWYSPEWPVLTGGHGGIWCPVCFAGLDAAAIWCLRRHVEPDTDVVARLAALLVAVSDLGDDAERVARCVVDWFGPNDADFPAPNPLPAL